MHIGKGEYLDMGTLAVWPQLKGSGRIFVRHIA